MDIGGSIPLWLWASSVSAIIVWAFKGRLAALATGILVGLVLTRGFDFINLATISSVKSFVYWLLIEVAYLIVVLIGSLLLIAIIILLAMSGGGGGGRAGDGGTTR